MEPISNDPERTQMQDGSPDVLTGTFVQGATANLSSQTVPSVPGFVIESELGRGGMGVVYRATQEGLNRTVALKMVLSGAYAGKQEIARFLGEAEAVAAVRHSQVIQVYGFGEAEGRPFFAMEYLTGGSLAARLKKNGPMSPDAAAELVASLASGIEAAHSLGIVHRDLKPDNVLFDSNDVPKIVDFGLAKRGSVDLTATGAIMGTPSYMAPEQAAGRTKFCGPSVDIYALGVILFECLTGRVPFKGENVYSLLEKIRHESPPRVRDLEPRVPRDLDHITQKCLAKDTEHRYPSVGILVNDLRRYLAGERPLASDRSSLGGMWAVLDRGRHAAEFASYATLFLWLAVIMFTADCAMGLWMNGLISPYVGGGFSLIRVIAVPYVVYRYAGRTAVDGSASSRFLLALWSGHLLACVMVGVVDGVVRQASEATSMNYQQFSLITGVAFIALGPNYWGWCYAFGAGFLLLPIAYVYVPLASAFLFASMWALALICVSRYLSRLSRQALSERPN